MNNKVVLAYSGGLDTSYCIKYLTIEKQMEVYTAFVNTGGFSDEELETLYNEAQEKNKSNLELQIEELKAEKLKLQEQIKIFLEIQKKKEEIKDLMAKLE